MPKLAIKPDSPAVTTLKRSALSLFARHGIDGVTVREISKAAGQRNPAAVGYHFGSKEGLIRALVVDGAKLIDNRRNHQLDDMEKAGGPASLRDIVHILVYPSVDLESPQVPDRYNRFLRALTLHHRDLFQDALEGRWNSGYQRCLGHLRKMMPDMPEEIKNQRFIFMEAYLGSVLTARESRLDGPNAANSMWANSAVLVHFMDTIVAMLNAPYSSEVPSDEIIDPLD